jgi:hypothetical protein
MNWSIEEMSMFANLNIGPKKRPRLLGELDDLAHTRISSSEFKYGKGSEIFGQAAISPFKAQDDLSPFRAFGCYR